MDTSYGVCFINNSGMFTLLDNRVLDNIAKNSKMHSLTRSRGLTEDFPIEGKVYIVQEGKVFLSCMDENGKKIILDILGKGSIFGDLDFNQDQEFSNDCLFVEPVGNTNICEVGKSDFEEILKANPEFAISILSNLSRRLIKLEHRVGKLVFSDVEARLISQITSLGKEHGKEKNDKIELNIKVTHEKLAEMIGAARETVSDAISKLRKRKILVSNKKGFITLNKNNITSLN